VALSGNETPPIVEMRYEQAATIRATLAQPAGASGYTLPPSLGATVYNASLPATGTRTGRRGRRSGRVQRPVPLPQRQVRRDGWAVLGAVALPGRLPPAQPRPDDGRLAHAGQRRHPARTAPGGSVNQAYASSPIYAIRDDLTGCTPINDPSVHPSPTVGMAVLAQTDSNGELRISLPYGTWSFAVPTGWGTYYTNSFTLTQSSPANPAAVDVRVS
jgi:hypothetical protein